MACPPPRVYTGITPYKMGVVIERMKGEGARITGTNPWNAVLETKTTPSATIYFTGSWDAAKQALTVAVTDESWFASCAKVWAGIEEQIVKVQALAEPLPPPPPSPPPPANATTTAPADATTTTPPVPTPTPTSYGTTDMEVGPSPSAPVDVTPAPAPLLTTRAADAVTPGSASASAAGVFGNVSPTVAFVVGGALLAGALWLRSQSK